jgi:hypothetical protein
MNDGSILFADDTTLIDSSLNSTHLHQIMRETELKALNWFEANKLNLNNEKTTKIVFSTSSSYETQETKFLGVVLDSHLTWDAHVEYTGCPKNGVLTVHYVVEETTINVRKMLKKFYWTYLLIWRSLKVALNR